MEGRDKKRILLIAYHFPPSPAVGGLRSSGYAKYLPSYGWKPYVLTINEEYIQDPDAERFSGLEHVPVFRTRMLPSIPKNYVRLKAFFLSLLQGKRILAEELQREYAETESYSEADYAGFRTRLKRFVSSLLTLPDPENIWILPGLIRTLREIKRNRIRVILTSGPPYSAHLIGLIAKKIAGVVWVADYRDPWMSPLQDRLYLKSTLAVKLHQCLEKKVVANADTVLTTTGMLADHLKGAFHSEDPQKFQFLPNGFDPEKVHTNSAVQKYNTFTIAYTGVFYLGRSPEPVFAAIKRLMDEGKLSPGDIKLKLVGQCDTMRGKPTDKIIADYGLDAVVEISGQVPYLDALEIIRKSHLALLLAPDQKFMIPAKVYDYIGCGTEILAIADDGATSRLVNSTKTGKVFEPDDIEGIKEFISTSLEKREREQSIENGIAMQFSRQKLVGTLADLLDGLADSHIV